MHLAKEGLSLTSLFSMLKTSSLGRVGEVVEPDEADEEEGTGFMLDAS